MRSISLLAFVSVLFTSALAGLIPTSLSSRALLESGALQSPAPALAGQGAPHGAASSEAVAQLCDELQQKLGGKVVRLETTLVDSAYFQSVDHAYNAEQRAYKPTCTVLATQASHVVDAYAAIKAAGAGYGVRGGGHNPNYGWNTSPDVFIDFGQWCDVALSDDGKTADVAPGCRWGAVYSALEAKGKTVVGGRVSNVGMGATLGGGLSHLTPAHGLIADNVAAYHIVLPSGELVTAAREGKHADLWWALKGSANQLGIVVNYKLLTKDVGEWWGGLLTFLPAQVEAFVDAVAEYNAKYDSFNDTKAAIVPTITWVDLPAPSLVLIALAYNGPSRPEGIFDPFFRLNPVADTTRRSSYADINAVYDFGSLYGSSTHFRTSSSFLSQAQAREILAAWQQFATDNVGLWWSLSLSYESLTTSGLARSAAAGGNPQGWSAARGFTAQTYLVQWVPSLPTWQKQKLLAAAQAATTAGADDIPLFINYAAADQQPLLSYGNLARLRGIKEQYDAEAYVTKHAGGPRFESGAF